MPGAPDTTPADSVAGERADRPEIKHAADKVRIRFRKSGALRLLSHHDLMRTFERLLRRSELPFHRSQGFHPKPRLIFALSLPLGVVGCEEVVELELGQVLPLEDIHSRLARQAPPGLEILSVRRIPLKVNAQVCRLAYALPVPADRLPNLRRRIAEVLAASQFWIDRHRPHSRQAGRRLDVRPFLVDLQIVDRDERAAMEMLLCLTPAGTARPEEVLGLLGLEDLLDAGAVLERSRLELHDELPQSPSPPTPLPRSGGEGGMLLPSPPLRGRGVGGEGSSGTELEKGSHEKRDAD